MSNLWLCRVFGELVENETRPEQCPGCGAPSEEFNGPYPVVDVDGQTVREGAPLDDLLSYPD